MRFENHQLISFLESPASYLHGPSEVRSTRTHSSWVFIASPFVFKVKKPVNLGFLDFSTLEKRHHFCEREVQLNWRLCPEVYLGVVPIYQSASGFSFKPKGEIAEYSVKMRQLLDGWFLRQLVAKGSVEERQINRVILSLHRFYESQTPTQEIEAWAAPDKLRISTDENFVQVEPFVGKTISPVAFETIRHFTNSFYAVNQELFRERTRQHRIRDCHGDLHLDHVHITPEATTIFDCIEFNDRFRFIDIANDLAFLAMDFDFEGRSDLAKLLGQNAARAFHDNGMLKVTNFYKCYRAFVRGKVESLQTTSKEVAETEKHEKRAARYFHLALGYATSGSELRILVVMGRVGTGKTTVAQQLGGELDWPVFSSDRIRKTLAGVPLSERTGAELRDKVYSPEMTEMTYKRLLARGLETIKTHRGVILDATFSRRTNRDFLREQCAKANVHLQVIELEAQLENVEERLRAREQNVTPISDARLDDLEKLTVAYELPVELAPDLIKISTNSTVPDAVKAVLLQLAEKQVRYPTWP